MDPIFKLPVLGKPQLPTRTAVKRRTAIRVPVPTEHQIQCAFITWAHLNAKAWPELALLFAVPNGGYRPPRTAAKLAAEGVRAGVPDVLLPVARGGWIGLALEFKRPGGKLSPAQIAYIDRLVHAGWLVLVVDDAQAAAARVRSYLDLAPTIPPGNT